MAIVEFINRQNRSYKGMKNVINYVLRDDKAISSLISGIGVNPNNAYDEFVAMKNIMGKTDKRLWYHFVQSFPPYDNVTPEIALEVANRLTEHFKDEYQILIAVHQDKEHIHTHFIMNTVNVVTCKKYTQNRNQMKEIQALSDRICEEYGLHTLPEGQRDTGTYMKTGEYRVLQNGVSWKADLKYAIDTALQYACSRGQFIHLMKSQGYGIRWEDNRKNITFTTPTGMKCRDRKLGNDDYYNKDNFEKIFEMNSDYNKDEDIPPVFQLLDVINDVIGGNADDMVINMLVNIDTEGLSYLDLILLYKRLEDSRQYAKFLEEVKYKNAQAASNMMRFMSNVEDMLRWYAEHRESESFYDVGVDEFFNDPEECR